MQAMLQCGQECWQIISPMDMEPAPGTRPPASSRSWCARPSLLRPSPRCKIEPARLVFSPTRVWASRKLALPWKAGRFSGQDFLPPARWDVALSGWPSRWLSMSGAEKPMEACACVYAASIAQLPFVSPARAVSMAWQRLPTSRAR